MFHIYLNPNYLGQKILVNLDEIRDLKFNAGEKIEVTEEELKQIGDHKWLIVEEYNGN
jgi:hypothetical protein